jgi:homogentisate 1,2-dioxygenase
MATTNGTTASHQPLEHHPGFGNHIESSAYPHSLPQGRNNPRIVPCGLYAEQLSGTAFTAPRCENRRTWLYRKLPSVSGTSTASGFRRCGANEELVGHSDVLKSLPSSFGHADWNQDMKLDPNPMRWGATPPPLQEERVNFVQGMHTMLGSGDPATKSGIAIYVYAFNEDMSGRNDVNMHVYNSDGDFLIVPQQHGLAIQTEMGKMEVTPGEICVIPRGVVFTVNMLNVGGSAMGSSFARGYMLEIFRGHFFLPELGPIGSNGLANGRDFLHPTAHYDTDSGSCVIVNKFGQELFARVNPHSPYNVVAWHGNYLPYKYDLRKFCAINSVSYDHPDPSIYTVLTAKGGDEEGTALADFVIFPPRVMATDENTMRPPWFHRNVMTEYMGLIYGEYDAKKGGTGEEAGGFVPGGSSLHSIMIPHGPDAESYYANVRKPCKEPTKFDAGLAFMFESSAMCKISKYALSCHQRETEYAGCWDGFKETFPDTHA